MGLGQLLVDQPDRDDGPAADEVTRNVLQVFGMTAKQALLLTSQALPDVTVSGAA